MSELAKRIVAAIMKDMDRAAGFVLEDLSDFAKSELEAVVDDALAPPTDEDDARRFLWMNHGCPPEALKGDEGEMQCNAESCHLDFKGEPLDSLLITLFAQGRLTAGEMPDAVPVADLRTVLRDWQGWSEDAARSAEARATYTACHDNLAALCDAADGDTNGRRANSILFED
jgi:hypothetical protein